MERIKNNQQLLTNILVYFIIIVGLLYLYFPFSDKNTISTSVEFIYSQF